MQKNEEIKKLNYFYYCSKLKESLMLATDKLKVGRVYLIKIAVLLSQSISRDLYIKWEE
jgi:hypothetical protein